MSDQRSEDEGEKVLGDNAGVYRPHNQDELAVDFGGFIVGLYQSALMAMGEIEDPSEQLGGKDLDSARHTIDILKLLQRKTQGNPR